MKKFEQAVLTAFVGIIVFALIWEKVSYPNETVFEVLGYVFELENMPVFVGLALSVGVTDAIVRGVAKLRQNKAVKEEEPKHALEHASFMTIDQVRQMPRPVMKKKPQPRVAAAEEV